MRTVEQQPAPVEEEVIRGLMKMLSETFNVVDGSSLFYGPSSTKMIAANQQRLKTAGKSLSWPIMFVKLSAASRNLQVPGYNQKSLARHGVYVTRDNGDRSYMRKLHPMRVDMEFEIAYLIDDQRKALRFVSDWMTLGQENRLNFTVAYYGVGIDIAVALSPDITVPEKEGSVDEALNVYEFGTSLTVGGYMTAQHVDNDSEIFLVKSVNVGVQPVDDVDALGSSKILNAALAYRSTR